MLIFLFYFTFLSTCLVIHLCSGQSEVTRRMEEMTLSKRGKHDAEGTGVLPRAEIVRDEHPLSLGKTSVWNQYFQVTLVNNKITCWWVLHFCIICCTLPSLVLFHIVIADVGPTIFAMCLSHTVFLQCE